MQILAGEKFVRDVCTLDGQLQYFLPANERVFPHLAEFDPLYERLYGLLAPGTNGLLRAAIL